MPWSSQAILASIIIVQGDTGGVFIYNSSNQLVDSMAFQANIDPQTSSNLAGIANYGTAGLFAQLLNAVLFLGSTNASTRITTAARVQLADALDILTGPELVLDSPVTAAGGLAQIILRGESADTNVPAAVLVNNPLLLGQSSSLLAQFSTDGTGYPTVTDNIGLALNLSGCQPASGNKNTVTATTFTNLAFGLIPANDAEANAVYELEMGGYGTQGTTTQDLHLQARFGASPGADTDVVGVDALLNLSAMMGISDGFQWSAKVRAQCLTSGGAATWRIYVTGTVTDTTLSPITTGHTISFAVGTGNSDVTQDSTAQIKMGLSAKWASATGAPTITKSGSQFGRRG